MNTRLETGLDISEIAIRICPLLEIQKSGTPMKNAFPQRP